MPVRSRSVLRGVGAATTRRPKPARPGRTVNNVLIGAAARGVTAGAGEVPRTQEAGNEGERSAPSPGWATTMDHRCGWVGRGAVSGGAVVAGEPLCAQPLEQVGRHARIKRGWIKRGWPGAGRR